MRATLCLGLLAAVIANGEEPNVFFDGRLFLIGESRIRYEDRANVAFGAARDYDVALLRQRLGFSFRPNADVEIRVVGQDTRAPLYGPNAPNSLRDGADLYEAYIELFGKRKTGFAMRAGRSTLSYGDTRFIGSPQWANLTRTYDMARAQWKTKAATWEFLFVSPTAVQINRFNRPILSEHMYGTYNTFGKWAEAYLLRHQQVGLESVIAGGRLMAALKKWKLTVEPVMERVKRGAADTGEGAVAVNFARKIGKVDLSLEYKYASSGFDQMYPAIHDKLGHEDLFAWRNLHNARAFGTWRPVKSLAVNFMYNANWLVDPSVGVFNTQNRLIVRDTTGRASHWAGQEFDGYINWNYRKFLTLGGGVGAYANGRFFHGLTPDRSPVFYYIHHTFTM
ncbi:MAG TPA: alginate export family protein [Bryobacteraceae bacterium]|nr:alginate export family protein [Bryobacteraceae bacterium]